MKLERIGLIGYGEVGKTFCAGLLKQPGVTGVGAWDLKFAQAETQATERAHAAQCFDEGLPVVVIGLHEAAS